MRLILGILVFVPCAVSLSIFAVENRQVLALQFSPLAAKFELPVAIWLFDFPRYWNDRGTCHRFYRPLYGANALERRSALIVCLKENQKILPKLSVMPTRAAFSDNGSTREGGQSRLTLTDDR